MEETLKPEGFSPVGGLAEDLIQMGTWGVHPLFESDWIRRAFARLNSGCLESGQVIEAHFALKHLVQLGDLGRMRAHMHSLPDDTVDLLVFLYFRSLDQLLDRSERTIH
jgi:hypothetical protein